MPKMTAEVIFTSFLTVLFVTRLRGGQFVSMVPIRRAKSAREIEMSQAFKKRDTNATRRARGCATAFGPATHRSSSSRLEVHSWESQAVSRDPPTTGSEAPRFPKSAASREKSLFRYASGLEKQPEAGCPNRIQNKK